MESFDKIFNTLVLLIGTNPLPNFVVAEFFLINNPALNKILMIYSEKAQSQAGTKKYADNLQELIQKRHKDRILNFIKINLSDVSNAKQIERDLNEKMKRHLNETDSIHLNYTGGTKAMVIHTYRWIEKYASEQNIDVSFSYLDARNYRIIYDDERTTKDLRKDIKLKMEELIKLHGFELMNETEEFLFKEALDKFKEIIDNGKLSEYFSNYKREFLTNEKGNLLKKVKFYKERIEKLKEKKIEVKAEGLFLDVVKSMPEEYRLFNEDGSPKEPPSNKHLELAIKFLDGKWFERYVYEVLRKNITGDEITIEINWKFVKPEWKGSSKNFEIDVLIIKGYQLIGISCTTSKEKGLCKNKGFEIFMRTRQIGGDESRAILISTLKQTKQDTQDELEVDTGGKENILVLGIEDLKEEILAQRIKEYIE